MLDLFPFAFARAIPGLGSAVFHFILELQKKRATPAPQAPRVYREESPEEKKEKVPFNYSEIVVQGDGSSPSPAQDADAEETPEHPTPPIERPATPELKKGPWEDSEKARLVTLSKKFPGLIFLHPAPCTFLCIIYSFVALPNFCAFFLQFRHRSSSCSGGYPDRWKKIGEELNRSEKDVSNQVPHENLRFQIKLCLILVFN